jgi:ribonuclease HI
MTKSEVIVTYTDGSFKGSTSCGGYAAYVVNTGDVIYGGARNTTNNRMELMAVLAVLDNASTGSQICIHSDSAYVVNAISKGWIYDWIKNNWRSKDRTPIKNVDLWTRIYDHLSRIQVTMIWVKGHAGNPYNEMVDEIASYQALNQFI